MKISSNSLTSIVLTVFTILVAPPPLWISSSSSHHHHHHHHLVVVAAKQERGGRQGGKGGGSSSSSSSSSCKLDILDGVCGDIESDIVTDLCMEAEGFGDNDKKCDDFLDDPRFLNRRFPIVTTETCNVRFGQRGGGGGAYHLEKYFAGGGSTGGLTCCPACTLDLTALDDEDACTFVSDTSLGGPSTCGRTVMDDGFDGIAVVLLNDGGGNGGGGAQQGGQIEFYCCSFGRVR